MNRPLTTQKRRIVEGATRTSWNADTVIRLYGLEESAAEVRRIFAEAGR